MQLHRLRLVNFRQHEDTELVLGAGLTGIVGPNGSGKSTLLEAVAFAMYGTPAIRGTRDSIRRRGAPPRSSVRVELDFSLGAHQYRVVRGLAQATLHQDGDPAPVANSLGAVTDKLTRLVGMTHVEFLNTYFTRQKELLVMDKMTGPERAQFLSRLLGFERLRVAQERGRERRNEARSRLQGLEAGLPNLDELHTEERRVADLAAQAAAREAAAAGALAQAEARLGEAAPRWKAMDQLRMRVQSLEADLRVAEHQVLTSQDRTRDLDRQITEALHAQAHLATLSAELASLAALRAEQEALQRLYAASTHRATVHTRLELAQKSLADLGAQLAALPRDSELAEARTALAAAREAVAAVTAELDEAHTAHVRDLQDAKTKRQALGDQYRELQAQIDRLTAAGQDGACPTCARPLGPVYTSVLGVLGRQAEEVKFNGLFYRQRIDQLHDEPAPLRDLRRRAEAAEQAAVEAAAAVSRLEAQQKGAVDLAARRVAQEQAITALQGDLAAAEGTYDAERHAEVRRTVAALEAKALEAERYRGLAERAARLAPELLAAEQAVTSQEEKLAALRKQREELGYSEPEFEALRASLEAAEEGKRRAELETVEARSQRAVAEEAARALARRRGERDVREAEVRRVGAEFDLLQELDAAFTDLRTDLNAALRPDLSELASGLLRDLTNGRYADLELNEDYEPTLVEDGEVKPVISGGEEDVANLALRLAISQMIAERAGQPLSLLILDEVFGSLDEERRAAVVGLLRNLADRFPQVILITHIESVRDGFDRIIRVERDTDRRASVVREEPVAVGADHVAA